MQISKQMAKMSFVPKPPSGSQVGARVANIEKRSETSAKALGDEVARTISLIPKDHLESVFRAHIRDPDAWVGQSELHILADQYEIYLPMYQAVPKRFKQIQVIGDGSCGVRAVMLIDRYKKTNRLPQNTDYVPDHAIAQARGLIADEMDVDTAVAGASDLLSEHLRGRTPPGLSSAMKELLVTNPAIMQPDRSAASGANFAPLTSASKPAVLSSGIEPAINIGDTEQPLETNIALPYTGGNHYNILVKSAQ